MPSEPRRASIDVMADILRISGHKTAIMYRANLSYAQTQRYLAVLMRQGLMKEVTGPTGRHHYQATDKGRKLLFLIENIESLVHGMGQRGKNALEALGQGDSDE